ncbi:MAG: CHAP domain-containing protein [Bifidobacteriaceae bacterium]|jgi:surface antigen|nr:CHAP domain-containing protein [Bifidobacteriaceae bacterium]
MLSFYKRISLISGIFSVVLSSVLFTIPCSAYADNQTDNGTSVSSTFIVQPQISTAGQETSNIITSNLVAWALTTLKVPFSPVNSKGKSPENDGSGFLQVENAKRDVPVAKGNTYVPGQCTWYAYNRRNQLGLKVGAFWGNAVEWSNAARADGYSVNNSPRVGDILVFAPGQDGAGGFGHVAIVEEIGANNSVRISEMNYLAPFNYNERWIFNADQHTFIH